MQKNFIFISPNFPKTYYQFPLAWKQLGGRSLADSTGKATVNEHFPTQDISCIVTIFFMRNLLVYNFHYRRY